MDEKKNSYRLWIIFSTVFLFLFASQNAQASWLIYHKPAFEGKVIDIDTKIPIEGAVILAYYERSFVIGFGEGPVVFSIQETLTDKEGKFVVPSYTTVMLPVFLGAKVSIGVYKPGYAQTGANEEQFSKNGWKHIEEYTWYPNTTKIIKFHDGVFELPKLETKEDRIRAVPSRESDSPSHMLEGQRLLTQAINEEYRHFGMPMLPVPKR
jgi:hypothetical protein